MKLWNRDRTKLVEEPTNFVFDVTNNAISPCGNYMVVFNNYKDTLTFQDLSTMYSQKCKTLVLAKESVLGQFKSLISTSFSCLHFLPSSSHVILGTNSGSLLKVANPLVQKKTTEKYQFLDLCSSENSPEEIILLSGGTMGKLILAVTKKSEKSYRFHVVNTSKMVLEYALTSENLEIELKVTAACFGDFSLDEHLLLIGSNCCKVVVVSVKNLLDPSNDQPRGQVLQVITDHKHPITVLTLSPNQSFFLSGSYGFTQRLWKREVSRTVDLFIVPLIHKLELLRFRTIIPAKH